MHAFKTFYRTAILFVGKKPLVDTLNVNKGDLSSVEI